MLPHGLRQRWGPRTFNQHQKATPPPPQPDKSFKYGLTSKSRRSVCSSCQKITPTVCSNFLPARTTFFSPPLPRPLKSSTNVSSKGAAKHLKALSHHALLCAYTVCRSLATCLGSRIPPGVKSYFLAATDLSLWRLHDRCFFGRATPPPSAPPTPSDSVEACRASARVHQSSARTSASLREARTGAGRELD